MRDTHLVIGVLNQLVLRPPVLEAVAALHLIPSKHPVSCDRETYHHRRHLLVLALPQQLLPPQVVQLTNGRGSGAGVSRARDLAKKRTSANITTTYGSNTTTFQVCIT